MDGVDRPDHAFRSRLASRFGPLALDGGVALLWLLAWYVARVQEYAPHASLWFPPAGLTFGVGLAFGWRGLPGIVLAATIATMTLGELAPSATASSLLSAGVAFGAVTRAALGFAVRRRATAAQTIRAESTPAISRICASTCVGMGASVSISV